MTVRRAARRQSCSQDSHIPIMPMYVCYNMNHVYLQIRNKTTTRPSLWVTNTPDVSAENQPEALSRPTRHRCKHPQRLALRIGLHIRPRPPRVADAIHTHASRASRTSQRLVRRLRARCRPTPRSAARGRVLRGRSGISTILLSPLTPCNLLSFASHLSDRPEQNGPLT